MRGLQKQGITGVLTKERKLPVMFANDLAFQRAEWSCCTPRTWPVKSLFPHPWADLSLLTCLGKVRVFSQTILALAGGSGNSYTWSESGSGPSTQPFICSYTGPAGGGWSRAGTWEASSGAFSGPLRAGEQSRSAGVSRRTCKRLAGARPCFPWSRHFHQPSLSGTFCSRMVKMSPLQKASSSKQSGWLS